MFLAPGHAVTSLLFDRHFVLAIARPNDVKLLRFKSVIPCATLLSLLLISGMTAAGDKLSLLYSAQPVYGQANKSPRHSYYPVAIPRAFSVRSIFA